MDKIRISRLINFEEEDTSTGFNSVTGPGDQPDDPRRINGVRFLVWLKEYIEGESKNDSSDDFSFEIKDGQGYSCDAFDELTYVSDLDEKDFDWSDDDEEDLPTKEETSNDACKNKQWTIKLDGKVCVDDSCYYDWYRWDSPAMGIDTSFDDFCRMLYNLNIRELAWEIAEKKWGKYYSALKKDCKNDIEQVLVDMGYREIDYDREDFDRPEYQDEVAYEAFEYWFAGPVAENLQDAVDFLNECVDKYKEYIKREKITNQ